MTSPPRLPPPTEPAAAAAPPSSAPRLEGDVLRFVREGDFNDAGRDLYQLGAVLAAADVVPPPGDRRALLLDVEGRRGRTRLRVSLQPGPGGMVVVQLEDRQQLAIVLPEVLPPKAPPDEVVEREHDDSGGHDDDSRAAVSATGEQRRAVALRLEPSGTLRNPTSAEGVLRLSLLRPLTADDLAAPSTHLLLRWLLTSRGTVRVEVEMAGHAVHPFLVAGGREVRSAVGMSTLARHLVERDGRYVVAEVRRPPRMTHSGTMLQLLQEVVSAHVGRLPEEELERALSHQGARNPQLNDVGRRLLDGLGFSSSHKRLALKALTGRESVYDVTQHAAGARAALEVLYTLEVSGGLDGASADHVAQEEKRRREKERLDRLVEGAAGLWAKIERANHFEALGLHWSTPPRKIKPAFEELERLYGPRGEARAEAPDVCDRIWRRVSDAYAVVGDPARRRAHRKEAYALKWSAQIDVLVDRANIAVYRGDLDEARDLLALCQDIQPTPAVAERLFQLEKAEGKARARSAARAAANGRTTLE